MTLSVSKLQSNSSTDGDGYKSKSEYQSSEEAWEPSPTTNEQNCERKKRKDTSSCPEQKTICHVNNYTNELETPRKTNGGF